MYKQSKTRQHGPAVETVRFVTSSMGGTEVGGLGETHDTMKLEGPTLHHLSPNVPTGQQLRGIPRTSTLNLPTGTPPRCPSAQTEPVARP